MHMRSITDLNNDNDLNVNQKPKIQSKILLMRSNSLLDAGNFSLSNVWGSKVASYNAIIKSNNCILLNVDRQLTINKIWLKTFAGLTISYAMTLREHKWRNHAYTGGKTLPFGYWASSFEGSSKEPFSQQRSSLRRMETPQILNFIIIVLLFLSI